jgi:adenylylsulfate reductase subunit B
MPPVIDKKYCNDCGICAALCPTDVFSRSKDRQTPKVLRPDECWHCDACVLDCPENRDGRKALELRIPLQLQLLWIDPEAENDPYDIVGDHLGNHPETMWDMPRE